MLILEHLRRGCNFGVDKLGAEGHFSHLFKHNSTVDGVHRILAPGKGTVVLAKNCRNCIGILAQTLKLINDQLTRVKLVGLFSISSAERTLRQGTSP